MKDLDDSALKNEIDEISRKIDRIIERVEQEAPNREGNTGQDQDQ